MFRREKDFFYGKSLATVMLGQGIVPQDHHPLANNLTVEKINEMLRKIRNIKQEPIDKLPSHDEFLKMYCRQ